MANLEPSIHSVQFYESDGPLVHVVAGFLAEGLRHRESALVIATDAHRRLIAEGLRLRGIDVETVLRDGLLIMLDAAEGVRRIVVDGKAQQTGFDDFVHQAVQRLAAAPHARAYGEIVDLLWQRGDREAALDVEAMWNDLQSKQRFSLHCAYAMSSFREPGGMPDVCATHSHVLPPKSEVHSDLLDATDLRVQALIAEIAHRRMVEEELRQSRDDLEDFFENAVVPMHRVDRNGIILWANSAELELLGYAANEYIGQPITSFHANREAIDDILARLHRGETLRDVETTLIAKDGSLRHIMLSSNVRMRDGELVGTRCFSRDVTALQKAEYQAEVLHRLSSALSSALGVEEAARVVIASTRSVIGNASGIVMLLDPSGTQVERFVSDDSATDPARYGGIHFDADLPVCEAARTGQLVWIVGANELQARYPHLVELQRVTNARTWGAVPIVFHDRTLGSIGFRSEQERTLAPEEEQLLLSIGRQCAQAIERARLHDATEAARKEAERANRAKDDFLAMLGHELRNPLAPILGAVQLMKLRGEGAFARELSVLERQAQHMSRLIDDLLDVSRISRQTVRIEKRTIALAPVIRRAVETIAPICEQRQHHVSCALPDADVWLEADETRLTQIVTNLLTNAAKFTLADGDIRVTVEQHRDRARIVVQDNGVGVSPELLPHIFDLFVQGAQAFDRPHGGLGVGLALVRNLVALHDGTVQVHSDGPGRGTTVTVELPAQPAVRASQPELARAPRSGRTVTPRNILVVDDNEDAANLMAEMLRTIGHHVEVAHDGPDALELLGGFTPEVAILDLGLPTMNGFDLAAALTQRLGSAVRLFALTGYGQDEDRSRTAKAGFQAHFTKPVQLATILTALER